jgi:hypothetical protein
MSHILYFDATNKLIKYKYHQMVKSIQSPFLWKVNWLCFITTKPIKLNIDQYTTSIYWYYLALIYTNNFLEESIVEYFTIKKITHTFVHRFI